MDSNYQSQQFLNNVRGIVFLGSDHGYIKNRSKDRINNDFIRLGKEYFENQTCSVMQNSSNINKLGDLLTILALAKRRDDSGLSLLEIQLFFAETELRHREAFTKIGPKRRKRELKKLLGKPHLPDEELEAAQAKLYQSKFFSGRIRKLLPEAREIRIELSQCVAARPVFIPRRVTRWLATATRSEILTTIVLYIRRIARKFFRARCSYRLIQKVTGLSSSRVYFGMKSLRTRGVIQWSTANRHWDTWWGGGLWEFATDLTVQPVKMKFPHRRQKPTFGSCSSLIPRWVPLSVPPSLRSKKKKRVPMTKKRKETEAPIKINPIVVQISNQRIEPTMDLYSPLKPSTHDHDQLHDRSRARVADNGLKVKKNFKEKEGGGDRKPPDRSETVPNTQKGHQTFKNAPGLIKEVLSIATVGFDKKVNSAQNWGSNMKRSQTEHELRVRRQAKAIQMGIDIFAPDWEQVLDERLSRGNGRNRFL